MKKQVSNESIFEVSIAIAIASSNERVFKGLKLQAIEEEVEKEFLVFEMDFEDLLDGGREVRILLSRSLQTCIYMEYKS